MSNARRGRLVTLEGIEGVGKSSNLVFIADYLRNAGHDVRVTREPGGVPLAERIRDLLLDAGERSMPGLSELLLMFAARAAHLEQLIRPALEAGTWVVCDRFTDASYAYQGGGRGISNAVIAELERMVQGPLRPDLTLLLDADWQATRERRTQRGGDDRFEREGGEFFERVRMAYLGRARSEPDRICVIDATRDIATVRANITERLEKLSKSPYK